MKRAESNVPRASQSSVEGQNVHFAKQPVAAPRMKTAENGTPQRTQRNTEREDSEVTKQLTAARPTSFCSPAILCALCGSTSSLRDSLLSGSKFPRRRRQRRGVLLLVMLCLLILFAALGVTYVMVGSQYRKTSSVQPRLDQYAIDYRNQIDEAALQVLRGTTNPSSVLQIHSLLEDLYGNDSVSSAQTGITIVQALSSLSVPAAPTQVQLVDLRLQNATVLSVVGSTATGPNGALPWPMGQYYTCTANNSTNTAVLPSQSNLAESPYPPPLPIVGFPPYYDTTQTNSNYGQLVKYWQSQGISSSTPLYAQYSTYIKNQNLPAPVNPIVPNFTIAPSGYFNGCVLTFTSGPAAGVSTRIVGYDNGQRQMPAVSGANPKTNSTGNPTLRVLGFPGANTLVNESNGGTNISVSFVINGRPFNGTGFGFQAQNPPTLPPGTASSFGLVNATDGGDGTTSPAPVTGKGMSKLYALLPNPVSFVNSYNTPNPNNYTQAGGIGGADEDYDAADFQNMLLGLTRNPIPNAQAYSNATVALNYFLPYPSLHRPDMVQYWERVLNPAANNSTMSWSALVSADLDVARQIVLRPIGAVPAIGGNQVIVDHPNFTGSNSGNNGSYFDPVNGPLDVDNDGDGVMDSVWVDLGFPVQTAPDGTTFKPLFAIWTLDMDGRLNVNAHGNSAHTEATYGVTPSGGWQGNFATAGGPQNAPPQNPSPPGSPAPTSPPPIIGTGYGTAEINLVPLYTQGGANTTTISANGPTAQQLYQYLLAGAQAGVLYGGGTNNQSPLVEGRYGESNTMTAHLPSPSPANATAYVASTDPQSGTTPPYAGYSQSSSGGLPSQLLASVLGLVKHWDLPMPANPSVNPSVLTPTAYGSPPDLWGRAFAALDGCGYPTMPIMSNQPYPNPTAYGGLGGLNDTLNNPYLLNLSRGTAVRGALPAGATDNPFTPGELERLLRANDLDASALPSRLAMLLDYTSVAPSSVGGKAPLGNWIANLRNQVTTDSFDLPSPSILTPWTAPVTGTPNVLNQRMALPLAGSVADLLTVRLTNFSANPPTLNLTDPMITGGGVHAGWNSLAIQLQLMLPPDLMAGQRFDINRPFGNGRDDDGDGAVDEPDEYYLGEPAWLDGNAPGQQTPFPTMQSGGTHTVNLAIDWNGDGQLNAMDAIAARQLMARYLYVLASLLVEPTLLTPNQPGQVPSIIYDLDTANQYQVQYALAQWAINCVDFRDRDSIMTPFEFDVNPFDGWGVDGVVGYNPPTSTTTDDASGERGLVWGSERPELLITETLAWHDRRTEDTNKDSTNQYIGPPAGSGNGTDKDFDQRLMPFPACFIELYNPWVTPYSMRNTGATTPNTDAPSAAEVSGELYYYPQGNPPSPALPIYPTGSPPASPANNHGTMPGNPLGVALDKLAVDPTNQLPPTPVWRMIVVNSAKAGTATDPDDPYANSTQGAAANANFAIQQAAIERAVYFVQPAASTTYHNLYTTVSGLSTVAPVGAGTITVTYVTSMPVSPIKPGRYGVVGGANQIVPPGTAVPSGATPKNPANGLAYLSQVGRLAGATDATQVPTESQRVVLAPDAGGNPDNNQVWAFTSQNNPNDPSPLSSTNNTGNVQPAVAIVADLCLAPGQAYTAGSSSTNTPTTRFFSISDPPTATGYPTAGLQKIVRSGGDEYQFPTPVNNPYDGPLNPVSGADPNMAKNNTIPGYRAVHLQRLANPNQPYNPPASAGGNPSYPVNIYLTVDSAPIDITSFNGLSAYAGGAAPSADPNAGATQPYLFCSTQRGDQTGLGALGTSQVHQANSLFAHEPTHQVNVPPLTTATFDGPGTLPAQNFNWIMHSSIGYLNRPYGNPLASGSLPAGMSQAYVGSLNSNTGALPVFPWLTWNNRPYASPMELALVPKSRSSRMLFDYSPLASVSSGSLAGFPSIFSSEGTPPNAASAYATLTQPQYFGHLLNFFDGGTVAAARPYKTPFNQFASNLCRLLEYVQVPSKFVGTETLLGPSTLNSSGFTNGIMTAGATVGTENVTSQLQTLLIGDYQPNPKTPTGGQHWVWNEVNGTGAPVPVPYGLGSTPFQTMVLPPYNRVSEYRDPGRVNINTIVDPPVLPSGGGIATAPGSVVWQGIANGTSSPQWDVVGTGSPPSAQAVVTQTMMYNPGTTGTYQQFPPSSFTNPFRSAAGAALTNSINSDPSVTVFSPFNPTTAMQTAFNSLRDADATLLRPAIGASSTYSLWNQQVALFDSPNLVAAANSVAGAVTPLNDPTRNPFFRLQNISRMSNLLTTRSNVYAVWITVGYFQVTPWYGYPTKVGSPYPTSGPVMYDTAHPDGYQLGLELGNDSGDIHRHRAFYMIDRTIPVGFERGVDHNVQNAILLRRFIE